MDLHVLIVITCVFLASLFSLLFINKFFRGKTFEEVAAEKRLLAEKLYGTTKNKHYRQQQPRKISNKKDMKKDKKQKQQKDNATSSTKDNDIESHENESDVQSETQSTESSPSHQQKKIHVEFIEPEIIDKKKDNQQKHHQQQQQRKSNNTKSSGILLNKSEPVIVKESLAAESLNHFDVKHPKDVVELKKQISKDEIVVDAVKSQNENKPLKDSKVKETKKSSKVSKKDDKNDSTPQQQSHQEPVAVKEIKQHEEKHHKNDSPKIQNKQQQQQQQQKNKKKVENSIIEQLSGSDVIGVNTLMILFNQAELNRSEIQILIDYLLNKQQDTPINHSEWSDDIVQKLKKQLNEKEKQLQDEQAASAGIQAKLRDLRQEITAERLNFNATTKIYIERIQSKEHDINNLNQEIQNLNEKFNLERQQFQVKLHHEKQTNSQELLQQIQQLNEHNGRLQSEIVQLQMIANASHQTAEDTKQKMNDIVQQQQQQLLNLEQNLNDAKEEIQRQQYDLELAKIVENEKETHKVEIRNLQNALDSKQSELQLIQNDLKDIKLKYEQLNIQYDNLKKQYDTINGKLLDQIQYNDKINLQLNEQKNIIDCKDKKLSDYEISLKTLTNKEDELMKQINEQKEKNNELRTKNWKLVEALQEAEKTSKATITTTTVTTNPTVKRNFNNLVNLQQQQQQQQQTATDSSSTLKDEQRIRELFERLYPEATKLQAGSALTLSFDQWIEQVISTHIKQYINNNQLNRDNNTINQISNKNNLTTTAVTTTSFNCEENNHNKINNHHTVETVKTSNHHNDDTTTSTTTTTDNDNNKNNSTNNANNNQEQQQQQSNNNENTKHVLLENVQLRAKVEQLTAIVTKTENLLTNLETQARDQEAHWRNVVQSKQEEIHLLKNLLQNPNGKTI